MMNMVMKIFIVQLSSGLNTSYLLGQNTDISTISSNFFSECNVSQPYKTGIMITEKYSELTDAACPEFDLLPVLLCMLFWSVTVVIKCLFIISHIMTFFSFWRWANSMQFTRSFLWVSV